MLEIPKSKELLKDLISNFPKKPGIYKFLDQDKSPIYIGKAKNIRNRVSTYFKDSEGKMWNWRDLKRRSFRTSR